MSERACVCNGETALPEMMMGYDGIRLFLRLQLAIGTGLTGRTGYLFAPVQEIWQRKGTKADKCEDQLEKHIEIF